MLKTLLDTSRAYRQWLQAETARARGPAPPARAAPHLLLIAWSLPPDVSPGIYRPSSVLRHASEFGWRATGLAGPWRAPKTPAEREALNALPASTVILRAKPQLTPSWKAFTLATHVDGGFLSALELYRAAVEHLRSDPPDVVLASGPPHAVMVAGLFIARYFAAPLVMDYRDEWSECPFDFVDKRRLDRWWERRCLRNASRVVFTTESQRRHQVAAFPTLAAARTATVPNGWESADAAPRAPRPAERERVTLAFIGMLAAHCSAHAFLEALAALVSANAELASRLRIRFVGHIAEDEAARIERFPCREMIEVVGMLPKAQADSRMREADALLIFAAAALARYRPGKLYEYLAARRPVLVFGHRGEASELCESLEVGAFVAADDRDGLMRFVENLWRGTVAGTSAKLEAWLAQHSRRRLTGRMFGLLDEVVKR